MLFSNTKKTAQLFGKALLGIAITLIASNNSLAQQNTTFFGEEAAGKWMIGAKVANIDPNDSLVSDSRGIGIVLGYEFAKKIGSGKSSFEIEYISGNEEDISIGQPGSYEASLLNAFFTYRTAGDVYFKFKGGLSYVDIDVRFDTFLNTSFEDTSVAAGIGIGYRINDKGMIELEYSQDSGDSDLGVLSLNGLLKF